jgi:sialate O-acetylesterase
MKDFSMTLRSTRTLAALTLAAITTLASHALADVRLPHVFSDNMVLQQQMPLPVWGWDDPGQKVTVSIAGEEQTATTDADGHWKLSLPAMKADGKT